MNPENSDDAPLHDPSRRPPPGDGDPTLSAAAAPRLPSWIGDFRILRLVGAGGMGVVYEAEQQNPKRAVALKVVRGGAYVDETHVRMFRREVQTLARLKHPGIAAIHESGRTEDGQHFFAMELVRGETLGEFLARRGVDGKLSATEVRLRLQLFRKICDAIAYAHQKSVIHRDLKPSNVLVLREPASAMVAAGVPAVPDIKVLDFGLARITDSDVAVSTVLTDLGSVQGTIPYMSPEQVRGNSDEIDLRTDVYSLGVILYEMLSGQLPQELRRVTLTDAVRAICEEPAKPLAKTWQGSRKLDADLATIVHMALEKEPARRYQTASALSDDIQRYLTDQAILARPPRLAYQMRKLVSRHKAAFGFAATLILLLVGFALTMAVLAGRIARERDRANREAKASQEVADFLENLFHVSEPFESRGNTVTARELLDQGAQRIEQELAGQPLVKARMMETIGKVYTALRLDNKAEPQLLGALAIRERQLEEGDPELARSLRSLGSLYVVQSRYDEARRVFERALVILEKLHGPNSPEVAWCLYGLVGAHMGKGEIEKTREVLTRAIAIFERKPTERIGLAWCLNDLGTTCAEQGDYAGALAYYEKALAIKRQVLDPAHPDLELTLNNIGRLHSLLGDFARAQPILEHTLSSQEKFYGPEHPTTGEALLGLAEMWQRRGDLAQARPLAERALAIQEKFGPSFELAIRQSLLATILRDANEYAAAESLFRRAIAIESHQSRSQNLPLRTSLEEYAKLLRMTNRVAAAELVEVRLDSLRAATRAQ